MFNTLYLTCNYFFGKNNSFWKKILPLVCNICDNFSIELCRNIYCYSTNLHYVNVHFIGGEGGNCAQDKIGLWIFLFTVNFCQKGYFCNINEWRNPLLLMHIYIFHSLVLLIKCSCKFFTRKQDWCGLFFTGHCWFSSRIDISPRSTRIPLAIHQHGMLLWKYLYILFIDMSK